MNQPVFLYTLRGLDGYSDDAFIRLKQLIDLHVIPFSASTYWRKVKQGDFPPPVKNSDPDSGATLTVKRWVPPRWVGRNWFFSEVESVETRFFGEGLGGLVDGVGDDHPRRSTHKTQPERQG